MKTWTMKTTVSAEPKTYRQRAPPGIGSSSASFIRSRKPVRSSSQSASCLNKGDLLLALGPEPLELDADLGVVALGQLDLEPIHRPRRDLVLVASRPGRTHWCGTGTGSSCRRRSG